MGFISRSPWRCSNKTCVGCLLFLCPPKETKCSESTPMQFCSPPPHAQVLLWAPPASLGWGEGELWESDGALMSSRRLIEVLFPFHVLHPWVPSCLLLPSQGPRTPMHRVQFTSSPASPSLHTSQTYISLFSAVFGFVFWLQKANRRPLQQTASHLMCLWERQESGAPSSTLLGSSSSSTWWWCR